MTEKSKDKDKNIIDDLEKNEYKYGFSSDIQSEVFPPGINEDVIRKISAIKEEPDFLLEWRLKAYRHWLTMEHPTWAHIRMEKPDFQSISYYAQPSNKSKYESLDEVDPEILSTFEKLGIPLEEQKLLAGVAVDAVMDSVSVHTQFRDQLEEKGVLFCSFSEAARDYPELVKKYLGTVVPYTDNYYAALNSAVFSDGSFVFIPKGVR